MRSPLLVVPIVVLAVALTAAQAPAPQPQGGNQARLDAIRRKLDEKNEQIAKAREARRSYEDQKAHPPPKPPPPAPPPSKDDDYLQDAQDLMEILLRTFGSATGSGIIYSDREGQDARKANQAKEDREFSQRSWDSLLDLRQQQDLERLEKERATLEQEYLDAGGRLGLLQYAVPTATKDPEQVRLEQEYIEQERQRQQQQEQKTQKPTPPGPPPPPPPISFNTDSPAWDVASSYGISGSSFGLSASYQLSFVADSATTPPVFMNASSDPVTQGQDAFVENVDNGVDFDDYILLDPGFNPQSGWHDDMSLDWSHRSSNLVAMLRSPRVSLSARQPSSRPARRPQPGAKVFFTSLGGSTGATVQMTVVNDGNVPIRIASDGFALVPIARMSVADVQRELKALSRLPQKTLTLKAYCRDLQKAAPAAGAVMRLADAATQAQMAPFQRALAASRRLLRAGVLKPDVDDRELYLDSVRQWVRWTLAEKFNERSFITAFIEHTKKNTLAAGQKWERAYDAEARQIAGERWRDVQRVLAEAQVSRQ